MLSVKSNFSAEPSKRLTDQELFDQCSTFLHAGSDTFAMALTWAMYLLSQHSDVQKKLRQEIRKVYPSIDGYHSDISLDSGFEDCVACNRHVLELTDWSQTCSCLRTRMDAFEKLTYLDNVVRETLRFCPAVHATIRVANRDDHIPLSHPVTLKNGTTVGTDLSGYIAIKKGSYIHIPIEGFSYSEDIWGPDALEFRCVISAHISRLLLTTFQGLKDGQMFKNGIPQSRVFIICYPLATDPIRALVTGGPSPR